MYLHRQRKLGENNFKTKANDNCGQVLLCYWEEVLLYRRAGLEVIFEQLEYCCPDSINNHIFSYYGKCRNYQFRNAFRFFFVNGAQKGLGT